MYMMDRSYVRKIVAGTNHRVIRRERERKKDNITHPIVVSEEGEGDTGGILFTSSQGYIGQTSSSSS